VIDVVEPALDWLSGPNYAFEPTPDCGAAFGGWPDYGAAQRGR